MAKRGAKGTVFDVGYAIDVGSRGNQEDSLGFRQYEDGSLLAVLADGMGGHAGGEVASEMAVRLFGEHFPQTQGDIPARLEQTLRYTQGQLCQQAQVQRELHTMGATLVAVFLRGKDLYWLSVGDSLLYVVDEAGLAKLNTEHTVRERFRRLLESGKISRAEFEAVEEPHALTSALGPDKLNGVDSQQGTFPPDGVLVLASDGLLSLEQAEVRALVDTQVPAQMMADHLLQATLAKRRPGQDNTGIIVIRRKPRQSWVGKPWLVALSVFLVLGAGSGLLYQLYQVEQRAEQERQEREQAERKAAEAEQQMQAARQDADEAKTKAEEEAQRATKATEEAAAAKAGEAKAKKAAKDADAKAERARKEKEAAEEGRRQAEKTAQESRKPPPQANNPPAASPQPQPAPPAKPDAGSEKGSDGVRVFGFKLW